MRIIIVIIIMIIIIMIIITVIIMIIIVLIIMIMITTIILIWECSFAAENAGIMLQEMIGILLQIWHFAAELSYFFCVILNISSSDMIPHKK